MTVELYNFIINQTNVTLGINTPVALKEKQYFNAYMEAVQQGSCKNKVIRAMYAGPRCVGKSSIMKVFTQQPLVNAQNPTQVADQSDKMVHVKIYKIKDRTTHDFCQILDNGAHQIVELQYANTISNQNISTLKYDLIAGDPNRFATQSTTSEEVTTKALALSHAEATTTDNSSNLWQRQEIFRYYYHKLLLNNTIDDNQYAKIWDFGGHSIYHVTHQPFLSGNSIYVLVFNINQNLDDKVVTRDGRLLNMTYLQSMQEWLTSIIGGNSSQDKITVTIGKDQAEYSLPIVILVASHGDCMANKQQGLHRFRQFEQELRSKMPCYNSNIYSSRIIFNCNPDDVSDDVQTEREQYSLHFHEIIKSFIQRLPFMCNPIPIRWFIIATILHAPITNNDDEALSIINQIRAARVHKIMTVQEIQLLAKDFGLYEGFDKLISMLSYLHDLGEIIFCRKGDQHGIVVTDVDWLLDIFRSIIQLQDCESGSFQIQSMYEKAGKTGRISTKYIDYVLKPFNLNDETKKSIINLMETYDILCAIKSDNDNDEGQYFVPYLLRSDIEPFDLSQYYVSDTLYIGYEQNDVPYIANGIFYCLLSSCLKEWNNTKVALYYQCAKFCLTKSGHDMIVKKVDSHIALQYCYQICGDSEIANSIKSTAQASIYNNRPHDIVKGKLSSLMNDRMPKFKGAILRYYVRCTECGKLTLIDDASELQDKNFIQCQNCNRFFKSQSIHDWMKLNPKYEKELEMERSKKIGMHDEDRERLQSYHVDIINQCKSNVLPICDYLYSKKIISSYQRETTLSASTNYEKMSQLLVILPECGDQAFGQLCECLSDYNPSMAQALKIRNVQDKPIA